MFLLPHWSFLHWGKKIVSVSGHFQNFFGSTVVRSVSLLIVIIVSKAFMWKACMVVSDISCHCIWTNTDYYNNKKGASLPHQNFWKLAWEANHFFLFGLNSIYSKTLFYCPPIYHQTRIPPWNYQVPFSFHVKTLVIMQTHISPFAQVSKDQMVNLLLIVPWYNPNQLCHTSMILQVFVVFTGRFTSN